MCLQAMLEKETIQEFKVAPAAGDRERMGIAEAEKEATMTGKPDATSYSESEDSSVVKENHPAGRRVIASGPEKRKRSRGAARVLVCYLRKLSPANILRRVRDCYVATLSGCAQNYSTSTYQPYGIGLMSCNSPLPGSFRGSSLREDEYCRSERCLSPAFKKAFNESLSASGHYRTLGALLDVDGGGSSPFRKSFSDFESSVSPTMRRAYSEAAALYSRFPANRRSSPGWTPNRYVGGQSMMMFPIQEAPDASFRKDTQERKPASFRKESADLQSSESSFRKEVESTPTTTDSATTPDSMDNVPEVPEASMQQSRSLPTTISI